jgi:predicted P-type ATPase
VACSNSDSILIAAQVNAAFFDKTGTLTKQGMDYVSARSAESWTTGQWTSDTMAMAMAVCHCLNVSKKTGEVMGNPVDRAMFKASSALVVKASGTSATIRSSSGATYKILRRFDFDHNRMTQSVIVQLADGSIRLFVKGSGEQIGKLCMPDTVPSDFASRLQSYSRRGVYQLGVGTKELTLSAQQVSTMTRDDVEVDLKFAGVLNFANQMREDTPEVIKQLTDADVQSIMLTGDNLYTGIHVARKTGIIASGMGVILGVLSKDGNVIWRGEDDVQREEPRVGETGESSELTGVELAMSGEAWQTLLSQNKGYAVSLAPLIRVFGRCSPHDKVSVVDTFTDLGYTTLMCGDGGNDCGALKAAHIGLALSDSDASIVAPLTSLKKDIADVLVVLKEGRAAMASTISAYKYVILYGNISSYCQLIMYALGASFADWMWLFVDVIWTVSFTLSLPLAHHADKLSKARPTASLLSLQTVGSVVGINIINFTFMALGLIVLHAQDWFQCRKLDSDIIIAGSLLSASDNYEITVVFLMVGTQLMSAAISFNFGYEYRQAWYRNYVFAVLSMFYVAMFIFVTLTPSTVSCLWRLNCDNDHIIRGAFYSEPAPIGNPFNSTIMPVEFRFKMLAVMLGNACAVIGYEYFVVNGLWQCRRDNDKPAKQLAMAAGDAA